MNNIKVSIIVPVYKVPEVSLRRCIESCINQTLKEIEIILVDDGSPDDCGEICDKYLKKDKRIKVIHKNNSGVSSARNIGILQAKGEYIGFVDSDDWVEKDFYEKMYYFGRKNNTEIVVSGYVKDIEDKMVEVLKREKENVLSKKEAMKALMERKIYVWSPCDKIYKIDIVRKNLFNENIYMGEDLDFIWRILQKINKLGYISLNKYHYVYRKESSTNSISPKYKKDSVLVMQSILKETKKILDKKLLSRIKELYLKEMASYCRLMLIKNEKKYNKEIKLYQKKIRSLGGYLIRNKDFKLKVKMGIIFFMLPNFICRKMKFLIK